MEKMGVVPKLVLGKRQVVAGQKDKRGNPKVVLQSTGPHKVKFLEEPKLILAKNFEGEPIKTWKFVVEENGKKYRWMVPLLNREGQPNYLLERTADIEVGDTRILEMLSRGAAKYIDIRKEGEQAVAPGAHDEEWEAEDEEDEDTKLARQLEEQAMNEKAHGANS